MSTIHYFQRYSQKENVATNNSLLLLSRLYQHSPNKFKVFLSDLLGDIDLEAGILFNQQQKGKNSIPDGTISQTSFKVSIETKLSEKFSTNQLLNHLKSFSNEDFKILLSLSPRNPKNRIIDRVKSEIKNQDIGVRFISITFKEIVDKFRNVVDDYEFELNQIINDFEDYCISSGLITDEDYKMRVVSCGWTLDENFKFNIYYDPADRGYSEHGYLGIYTQKSVRGVGRLSNVITAELNEMNKLIVFHSVNEVTTLQIESIKKIIDAAKDNNNWDIRKGHKFFCVDKFYPTSFKKSSKYPLQGTKFFNLKEVLSVEKLPSTEIIADLLKRKEW